MELMVSENDTLRLLDPRVFRDVAEYFSLGAYILDGSFI